MPVTFHIAGYLTGFTGGQSQLELDSGNRSVREMLDELWRLHVGLRDRVVTEQGSVRPHVNIFVGEDNIRYLDGLETIVEDGVEICILPSVSGGLPD